MPSDAFASFAPVAVRKTQRDDGTILLDNAIPLGAVYGTLPNRLAHWARERVDAVFLTEPARNGRRALTYGDAAAAVRSIGARLLALPVGRDRPLMIIGGNSINHALVMLAATGLAIPTAIVSPAYASPGATPWAKLKRLIGIVQPGLVVADDVAGVRQALAALDYLAVAVWPLQTLVWLDDFAPAAEATVAAAAASVTGETIAKLLFTSGSTGSPKAVINTQAMMVSNMVGLGLVWPFLRERPPVLVDWLPWNHTFGGNCCFDIALWFGGTLHIDEGRPMPGQIERTVAALRAHRPTTYFNVPVGYDALLPYLETDHDLACGFLGRLDLLFNSGAAMPASTRERLGALALRVLGRALPLVGGWGSTETAPFSTVVYFYTDHAANLGVPLPGTTIKLVPWGDRMELRVRGPNVMPGYWRQPEATAPVFDEEGYYCIGDAGKLADPDRPEAGLLFDGRIAENFKLSTGTWVNVGALRLAVVAALSPLVADAVIAGEARDELAALLFIDATSSIDPHPFIAARLAAYNAAQKGSSTRISRFAVLSEPPSATHDEITEKGYINQRAVLRRRAAIVDALFADPARAIGANAEP